MRTVDSLRVILSRLVVVASVIAAVILVIYVLLTVFDASGSNSIVTFFHDVARPLAWKFKRLFTPKSHKTQIAVNFLVAGAVYLVVGRIISRIVTLGVGSGRSKD